MRIKDISLENRPRERLQRQGSQVLSDAELLAIVLKTGSKEENVVDMSNRLISKYGIDNLSKCSIKELQEIKGIGNAKACQIIALFEFNKRHNFSKQKGKPIKSAKDVFEYCSPKLAGADKEHFMMLHLDARNRVVKDEVISIGTLTGTITHPREIFKAAIKESAYAVILVHNHPSGDPTPSEEDKAMTERLMNAGEILGIKMLDHVIIGKDDWYSLKEE